VSMSSLPSEENYARFEVFMAVTMKDAIFLDVKLSSSCASFGC
jgi:hypothetical protein